MHAQGVRVGDLAGKTVLVTGASKGIGAAIAAAAGRDGASVIAHFGVDEAGARAAVANVPDERKRLLQADFCDLDAVGRLWAEAHAWRGRVDVLVNNAALMLFDAGPDADLDRWNDVWEQTMLVNVLAPVRLMREAVNTFLAEDGGSIITLSSWAAQRGVSNPGNIAYGASKAAIRNATQTIARGYAKHNVLAYVIAPGVVRTRMSEEFAATQGGEAAVSAGLAMGEWVEPKDIAETVVFLARGTARHISGATIDINGASYIR